MKNLQESPNNSSSTELEGTVNKGDKSLDTGQSIDKQELSKIIQLEIAKFESFSGPIPPPDTLRGYEEIRPGFAERIVHMAEQEQAHRIECEKKIVLETAAGSKRGQWMGFLVAIFFVIAAVILGLRGHDWLAATIGGGTLVAIVTVFVKKDKTNSRGKDRDEVAD